MKNQIVINKVIVDKNGNRYLPVEKSGIPALYGLMDEVVKTRFEGEKQIYIEIKEILKWFKNELKYHRGKNKEVMKHNIKFMKGLMTNKLEVDEEMEVKADLYRKYET